MKVRLSIRAPLRGDSSQIEAKRTSVFDNLALLFRRRAKVAVEQPQPGDNVAQVVREQAKRAGQRTKRAGYRVKRASKRTKRADELEKAARTRTTVPGMQEKMAIKRKKVDG
jgi:hypothetical protein